jgi:uncharacterized membrane protein
MLKLEDEFLQQRSWAERLADWVGGFAGSAYFIALHLAGITAWLAINTGLAMPLLRPFDPFPFGLLGALVSFEGVLLAAFVLIKQNRMSYRADHRSHLDLQVNLLAEQEATKILQMLVKLSRHMGIEETAVDKEAEELASATPLEEMARDLDKRLRSGEPPAEEKQITG